MDYITYKNYFDNILAEAQPLAPYNDAMYMDYAKLNQSRMKRWDKHLVLDETLVMAIKQIAEPQHWIVISEPWCGDAAHILPFLVKMVEQNEIVSYDIQLRDTEPFLIEKYLTNGAKSIPKLIVRNAAGEDLFVWGPRPVEAQTLVNEMKEQQLDFEQTKIALQKWYNTDAGKLLCKELEAELKKIATSKPNL